ncbi:MAG: CinA family nicotinamide mononucleotide deamidase-related protein [Bacillota bacterium]
MICEIIFTGTELLLGQILNTNAQYLQQTLAALGIDMYFQVTVGDNRERLIEAITQASSRADLVIIGGGLGPTEDDLSRDALSEALGVPLMENPAARSVTERFFKARGVEMSLNNLKQALVPEGGIVLDNPVGTAPGIALDYNSVLYILIPGPPLEFTTMLDEQVAPLLRRRLGHRTRIIKSRILKLCGIGESKVDEILGPLLHSNNPTLAPTAKFFEIHLRITSKTPTEKEADALNRDMEQKVRELLGQYIYGTDNETLPEVTGRLLMAGKLTVAAAETCSGGYLSHLLTSFPECRDFFKLGLVSKIDEMESHLGIKAGECTAEILANSIKERAGSDIGLSITEPGGGLYPSDNRITIATSFKGGTLKKEITLPGRGAELRRQAVQVCLTLLWKALK